MNYSEYLEFARDLKRSTSGLGDAGLLACIADAYIKSKNINPEEMLLIYPQNFVNYKAPKLYIVFSEHISIFSYKSCNPGDEYVSKASIHIIKKSSVEDIKLESSNKKHIREFDTISKMQLIIQIRDADPIILSNYEDSDVHWADEYGTMLFQLISML